MQKNLFKDFHDVLCRWVMSGKHTITLTQIQAELPTASRDEIKMKKKLGEYFFVCRNGWFKIYKVTGVTEMACEASQVWGEKSYQEPYDAYARTCELNGKKPVAKEQFVWEQ